MKAPAVRFPPISSSMTAGGGIIAGNAEFARGLFAERTHSGMAAATAQAVPAAFLETAGAPLDAGR